jgi:hypothetical protein
MIRYLLASILVLGCLAPVWANEPAMKADAAYGVRYTEERVINLPQDQFKPYLTLFGDRHDPKFKSMVKWFDKNKTLTELRDQTHYNVIYSDTRLYRDRYAEAVPILPCVTLQSIADREPVAEFAGLNVPMTADALAKGLNTRAKASQCFKGRRQSAPDEDEEDVAPYAVDPPPQPLSAEPSVKRLSGSIILLILAIVGGVLGAVKHFSDEYRGR